MRRIKGIKDLNVGNKFVVKKTKEGYKWNSDGLMDKYLGKLMTVRDISSGIVKADEDVKDSIGLTGWTWYPEMIDWDATELINQTPLFHVGQKLVVTSDLEVSKNWSSSAKDSIGKVITVKELRSDYVYVKENYHNWFEKDIDWVATAKLLSLPSPTKPMLQNGDKVVYKNGTVRYVVLEINQVIGSNGSGYNNLSEYDVNLKTIINHHDIDEIWRDGVLIAKRQVKSKEQLEIERIEQEMRDLSDKQNKLADDLRKVKGV